MLRIYVQPNAKRNEVIGLHDKSLKIKIKAPPEDGRANAELCAFVAELLGIAKSSVVLESGQTSRTKVLFAHGKSAATAREALSSASGLK